MAEVIAANGPSGSLVVAEPGQGGTAREHQPPPEDRYRAPLQLRRLWREIHEVRRLLGGLETGQQAPQSAGLACDEGPEPALGYQRGPGLGPPAGLRVGILGPLEVTGPHGPLTGEYADLVLALALSGPGGLPMLALRHILAADANRPKSGDAVRQLISRTRQRLGLAGPGREWIEYDRAGHGRYRLHEAADLDWARCHSLAERGMRNGNRHDLACALELVRAGPFTEQSGWWLPTPLAEMIRAEIVDVAQTLASVTKLLASLYLSDSATPAAVDGGPVPPPGPRQGDGPPCQAPGHAGIAATISPGATSAAACASLPAREC